MSQEELPESTSHRYRLHPRSLAILTFAGTVLTALALVLSQMRPPTAVEKPWKRFVSQYRSPRPGWFKYLSVREKDYHLGNDASRPLKHAYLADWKLPGE